MLPLSLRKKKNAAGMTPHEEFNKHHKDLDSECMKWINDTLSQLIVVAALEATISFTSTITFPGGYNQETGYPVFSKKTVFPLFININSIAFGSASVSMVFALSVITFRYFEVDFFKTLPRKLIMTVGSLLVAILASTMAFTFNLFLLYQFKSPLESQLPIGIVVILILYMSSDLIRESVTMICDIYCGPRVWKGNLRYERDSMPSTRSSEQVLFQNI